MNFVEIDGQTFLAEEVMPEKVAISRIYCLIECIEYFYQKIEKISKRIEKHHQKDIKVLKILANPFIMKLC